MKPFVAFLLGVGLMLVVGAATDDSLKRIANTLDRMARSLEILASQPKR